MRATYTKTSERFWSERQEAVLTAGSKSRRDVAEIAAEINTLQAGETGRSIKQIRIKASKMGLQYLAGRVSQPNPASHRRAEHVNRLREQATQMSDELGMSREEIAEALDVSVKWLTGAFHSKGLPAPPTALQLAEPPPMTLAPEEAIAALYAGQRYEDVIFKPAVARQFRGSPDRQPWTGSSLTS